MSKFSIFLTLAEGLNRELEICPLLYGSLGLEQRLNRNLNADDIDILISEEWLSQRWETLKAFMEGEGYTLYDLHEHAFEKDGVSVAYASLESLSPFAGIRIANIPKVRYNQICYLLLDLDDYRKVYTASSKDGYRKDKKHKDDFRKIQLIDEILRNRPKRSEDT